MTVLDSRGRFIDLQGTVIDLQEIVAITGNSFSVTFTTGSGYCHCYNFMSDPVYITIDQSDFDTIDHYTQGKYNEFVNQWIKVKK